MGKKKRKGEGGRGRLGREKGERERKKRKASLEYLEHFQHFITVIFELTVLYVRGIQVLCLCSFSTFSQIPRMFWDMLGNKYCIDYNFFKADFTAECMSGLIRTVAEPATQVTYQSAHVKNKNNL